MGTTNRVFKTEKVIKLSISAITDDTILTDADGKSLFNLGDIDPSRIVMSWDITTLSGTTSQAITLKLLTTNDTSATALISTDAAVTQADGSTAFTSGSIAATGRGAKSMAFEKSDGSAASNAGKFIGVLCDKTAGTLTNCTGTVWLYIKGK